MFMICQSPVFLFFFYHLLRVLVEVTASALLGHLGQFFQQRLVHLDDLAGGLCWLLVLGLRILALALDNDCLDLRSSGLRRLNNLWPLNICLLVSSAALPGH